MDGVHAAVLKDSTMTTTSIFQIQIASSSARRCHLLTEQRIDCYIYLPCRPKENFSHILFAFEVRTTMNSSQLSRLIFKAFKLRGLQLKADATEALINVLTRYVKPIWTVLSHDKENCCLFSGVGRMMLKDH